MNTFNITSWPVPWSSTPARQDEFWGQATLGVPFAAVASVNLLEHLPCLSPSRPSRDPAGAHNGLSMSVDDCQWIGLGENFNRKTSYFMILMAKTMVSG